ncbi:MAG: helix-turn-helix domain-containing protein [Actinophytocola sp.]|uniref:TetR/AcrR family transcriptional regulator n=1 Tax=Actinophytocola sp. TaxID=1872138 RepID=UPI003C78BA2C
MERTGRRTGRPPLTERRKAATRVDIARAAVRLFTTRGVAATSADEIAAAAGISVRTLWRYFPTKESCVRPLLTAGIDLTALALRNWPPGTALATVLDDLAAAAGDIVAEVPTLLALVRLTRTEPGLRAVWLRAHDDAEPVFATALAERAGHGDANDLHIRLHAAMINAALRVAVEHHANEPDPAGKGTAGKGTAGKDIVATVRTALLTAAVGLN